MSEPDTGSGLSEPALPASTADGAARARALDEARNAAVAPTGLVTPTGVVTYASSGRLALIGPMAEASAVAGRIGGGLETVIVAPGSDAGTPPGEAPADSRRRGRHPCRRHRRGGTSRRVHPPSAEAPPPGTTARGWSSPRRRSPGASPSTS